jgi:putative oligomerization/nucleic acid binding protein
VVISRAFTVLLLALLSQSCAGLSRVEAPVREEPERFVRVEARYSGGDRQGAARFDHPLVLNAREWTRILENVWVRHEPGVIALVSPQEPPVPAFTADEIAFLSKWLSKAFKHVHPDEWVVFGLTRRRSPELTEITTGGWFVEGDRLNLKLANYRHVVSMTSVRDQLWDDPLHSSGDRYYTFVPGDYQSATLVGGGPLGDIRGTSIPQLAIDYKGFLKPPSAVKPAQKSDVSPPAVAPEEGRGSDTAQKLRELKQLRDDGTITEEEYRTKKKQLLERF